MFLTLKIFTLNIILVGVKKKPEQHHESTQPDALKEALTEFISTLIIVFANEGSGMAFAKVTDSAANIRARLIVAAIAHAFSLLVFVSVGVKISKKYWFLAAATKNPVPKNDPSCKIHPFSPSSPHARTFQNPISLNYTTAFLFFKNKKLKKRDATCS